MSATITRADVETPSIIKFNLGNKTYYTQGYFNIDDVEIIINEELTNFIWVELRYRHYLLFYKNLYQIDLSKFEINYPIKYYLFLDEINLQIEEYNRTDFKILEIIKKGNAPYMKVITKLKEKDLEWLNKSYFHHLTSFEDEGCVYRFSTTISDLNEIESIHPEPCLSMVDSYE